MTNDPATSHTTHSGEHRAPDLLHSARGPYEHDEPHGAQWAGQWIDDEIEKAKGKNMTPKEAYEERKKERNARREHLSDHEAREVDTLDLMDRLVTAFEVIGDGLQRLASKK